MVTYRLYEWQPGRMWVVVASGLTLTEMMKLRDTKDSGSTQWEPEHGPPNPGHGPRCMCGCRR